MRGATVNRLNGSGISKTQATNRARRHMLSWMDTPDDLLFVATDAIRYLYEIVRVKFKKNKCHSGAMILFLQQPLNGVKFKTSNLELDPEAIYIWCLRCSLMLS